MTSDDWSGTEEPTELERHYAAALLDTIAQAPTLEIAREFLARAMAAHRARTMDVALGRAVQA